jgi:predicted lipase
MIDDHMSNPYFQQVDRIDKLLKQEYGLNKTVPQLPTLVNLPSLAHEQVAKIKYAARYAGATYCNKMFLKDWNCSPHCSHTSPTELIHYFDILLTDTVGYIAHDKVNNQIVVSFRGSLSLQNWLHNFDFYQMKWPRSSSPTVKVHRGFYNSYRPVKDLIFDTIRSRLAYTENSNTTILVVGHSLGKTYTFA